MPVSLEPVVLSRQLKVIVLVLIVFAPVCPLNSLSILKHAACLELSGRGFGSLAFQGLDSPIRTGTFTVAVKKFHSPVKVFLEKKPGRPIRKFRKAAVVATRERRTAGIAFLIIGG